MLFKKGSTQKAKILTEEWIGQELANHSQFISIGLPEYDDRFKKWRVPLHLQNGKHIFLGEVSIDEKISKIINYTDIKLIRERIKKFNNFTVKKHKGNNNLFFPSAIPNKVILGNCIDVLEGFPPDTAQLVFTSPPYYNAKPEYSEYVLVYRKRTDKLIDWNLRKHHDPELIEQSKIKGDYEVTNVWKIHPGHSKIHPAVFPEELAEKIIRYYSFIDDLVLDPFAGTGTVGKVAYSLERRFLLIDNEPKYFMYMKKNLNNFIPINTRVDFDIHDKFQREKDES